MKEIIYTYRIRLHIECMIKCVSILNDNKIDCNTYRHFIVFKIVNFNFKKLINLKMSNRVKIIIFYKTKVNSGVVVGLC